MLQRLQHATPSKYSSLEPRLFVKFYQIVKQTGVWVQSYKVKQQEFCKKAVQDLNEISFIESERKETFESDI